MEIIKPQTNSFWFEIQQNQRLGCCNRLISLLFVFFVKDINLENLDSEGYRIDPFKNSRYSRQLDMRTNNLLQVGKTIFFSSSLEDHEILSGCKNEGEFHHRVGQSSQKGSVKSTRVCMNSLTGNPLLRELLIQVGSVISFHFHTTLSLCYPDFFKVQSYHQILIEIRC